MNVLFVTREPDACRLIASYLADDKIECEVQDDFLEFYIALQEGRLQYDVLALDFRQFQHMLCSVSDTFRALKHPVPFVFYNDPYPDHANRAVYWLQQNESLYEDREFHQLIPLFKRLNEVIEHPQVRPYISLLQPPRSLSAETSSAASTSVSAEIAMTNFRVRSKIPPALFSLFEYFYENRSKEISARDIAKQLFGAGFYTDIRRNCVYSYVSRLKKYMHADEMLHVDIIRSSQERYKMVMKM